MISLGAALACLSCDRLSPQAKKEKPKPSADVPEEGQKRKTYNREGYAAWYPVPTDSLAKRRAGNDELTAAHNRLRLGTLVRVTHLANGRSVIVRITDRGITKLGITIDICKEAAERLAMIAEGMALVRMEELPNDKVSDVAADSRTTPAP